jgi:hypothetical protein
MYLKSLLFFSLFIGISPKILGQGYAPGQYPVDSICISKLCETKYYPSQYYQYNAKNRRSSYQILGDWLAVFKKPDNFKQSGFLTIRFIINCKGEPCCFYSYDMDENYQKTEFDIEVKKQLRTYIETMGGWQIAENEGKTMDYYYYLIFTIKNGEFKSVAP